MEDLGPPHPPEYPSQKSLRHTAELIGNYEKGRLLEHELRVIMPDPDPDLERIFPKKSFRHTAELIGNYEKG